MVKNIALKGLLILGLVLILVGCSSLPEANQELNKKVIGSMTLGDSMSLAARTRPYPNLKSLVLEADLIVKGKVAENLPSDFVTLDENKYVISLFDFKIDEIFYSPEGQRTPAQFMKSGLVILQTGGDYQEISQSPKGPNKLLEKDKEYVLFLKYLPEAQDYGPEDKHKYGVVGEYSGQFLINDDETKNISRGLGDELKYGINDLQGKIKQLVQGNLAIKGQKAAKDKLWNSLGQEIRDIPLALPEFWEHEISFEKGRIGSPQGLKEAVAKISFKNPRLSFEVERNNKLHPSLTIFYYDIKEKEKIRQTVEENAHFSGPIPIYYAETKNYIIVTSPNYTNNGYVLKGKLFLLPLDVALQKFFAKF